MVTASRRANELAVLITNMGGTPRVVPTVGIVLGRDEEAEAKPFLDAVVKGVDYVIFMTGPGVQSIMLTAERFGLRGELVRALNSPNTTVIVRGSKPKATLARFGVRVGGLPRPESATTEGVAALLRERDLHRTRVAILWHGSYSGSLRRSLLEAGVSEVLEFSAYAYSRIGDAGGHEVLKSMGFTSAMPREEEIVGLIREVAKGGRGVDIITFTSPPAARNLFEVAHRSGCKRDLVEGMKRILVVAVGPSTRSAIEENGVSVSVMPKLAGMGAMMTALADFVSRRRG